MKAFYSDRFVLPLPQGHRFPMSKYAKLREQVHASLPGLTLLEPTAATDEQLALAHDRQYIERVRHDALTAAELRAIGFSWSTQMVERSLRSAGATIAACRAASIEGVAVNLAGGTHHAQRGKGAGYCVFNDAAIAARTVQIEGRLKRVAVIDLDVHQGDGTAQICADDESIFTLSIHGESNFPFRKQHSDLDVGLPDGTRDDEYLRALDAALAQLSQRFEPQLVIYLAGADAHEGDRLGRLKLSSDGMRRRDQRVFEFAGRHDLPIAVAMAGGYGRDIDVTVSIHLQTVQLAYAAWTKRTRVPSDEVVMLRG
ncbi:MAG: histone deacetylase family protein [Burkholderiaceae bacterium]